MKKSTLITLVVFAALVGGAVYLLTDKPERGITRMSFEAVDKDEVDRVVVTGKNPVELAKKDGKWTLASGRLADGAAVTRLLEAIAKMKSSDLVTRDDQRFAELEVDAEKGAQVKAYAGGELAAELTVGKSLAGGVAVRVKDGVFKVAGASSATFSRAAASWIERKVFEDKLEDVTRVDVRLAGQAPYALVKKDGSWAVEDAKALPAGFRFDADAARSLVSSLAGLRVKDYEDKDPGFETTGLGDDADALVMTLAAPAADAKPADAKADAVAPMPLASTRTLRLGKAKAGGSDIYASVLGKADVFTLHESTAKGLKKAVADLRDLKLLSFAKDKAQKLELRDGKNQLVLEKKDGAWSLAKASEQKPADFELDPAAVDRRLGALLSARGLRLADAKEKGSAGADGQSGKAVVTLEDGSAVTLAFGREAKEADGKEIAFARGNADAEIYAVAKWTKQNLLGGLASFKKQAGGGGDPWSNLDPKSLSSLPPDVRESLMKQMQQKQREQELLKQLQQQAPKAQ